MEFIDWITNYCSIISHEPLVVHVYLECLVIFFKFVFTYLESIPGELARQTQNDVPSFGSLPKDSQQPKLAQADTKSQELSLVLPCGWLGFKFLHHLLQPPVVCISKKLGLETELALEPRHCSVCCGNPKHC